ncbi:rhodanese-like domain-containing protein [Streptomyces sp. NPDC059999]|uniref:rhodanese-like domain-containing protein n=1 Tax=Streptomyces sp. NPDC059999 TaxID=3347030 RepID=UPI003694199D
MSTPLTLAVTVDQVHARPEEFTVVDVRTPGEYASGHLPGATNIPFDRIADSLPELRKAAELAEGSGGALLLVCACGARSRNAARTLAGHGVTAAGLTGGTGAWSAAGYVLEYPAEGRRAVWAMERQVRITAGTLVLLGLALGTFAHPAFLLLSTAVAGGLVFSALTDTCAMASVLGRLPFNRRR